MEKCAPVARLPGSQVDALTRLEEDTEGRRGEDKEREVCVKLNNKYNLSTYTRAADTRLYITVGLLKLFWMNIKAV